MHVIGTPVKLFSIVDRELQREDLYTVDDLKKKLAEAPINPKPSVHGVEYTFDWKKFIRCGFIKKIIFTSGE